MTKFVQILFVITLLFIVNNASDPQAEPKTRQILLAMVIIFISIATFTPILYLTNSCPCCLYGQQQNEIPQSMGSDYESSTLDYLSITANASIVSDGPVSADNVLHY